jgi:alpha-ketoglutarate-dependent taurine dioxygenase
MINAEFITRLKHNLIARLINFSRAIIQEINMFKLKLLSGRHGKHIANDEFDSKTDLREIFPNRFKLIKEREVIEKKVVNIAPKIEQNTTLTAKSTINIAPVVESKKETLFASSKDGIEKLKESTKQTANNTKKIAELFKKEAEPKAENTLANVKAKDSNRKVTKKKKRKSNKAK